MINLPDFFRPILWSYDFGAVDSKKHKKTIIIQTINYGRWKHWRWIAGQYGKDEVAEVIASEPASAFRQPALFLARILFGVQKENYALRGAHR